MRKLVAFILEMIKNKKDNSNNSDKRRWYVVPRKCDMPGVNFFYLECY